MVLVMPSIVPSPALMATKTSWSNVDASVPKIWHPRIFLSSLFTNNLTPDGHHLHSLHYSRNMILLNVTLELELVLFLTMYRIVAT